MNKRYRRTIIAGNWKMNKTPSEAKLLIDELKPAIGKTRWCEPVLCVPFTVLTAAAKTLHNTRIHVGAQNMSQHASGAFTGEISAAMLKDAGVKYVILGHSERRQYYGETDTIVNAKAHAAIKAGLRPIICVGESLTQREAGITMDLVTLQVKAALSNISAEQLKEVVFAYEPIWAIGTGKTATSEQAAEACAHIRNVIRKTYGARSARAMTIQYGGSMNAENARELLAQPDVDGGLIGGASLKAADFIAIIDAANQ